MRSIVVVDKGTARLLDTELGNERLCLVGGHYDQLPPQKKNFALYPAMLMFGEDQLGKMPRYGHWQSSP